MIGHMLFSELLRELRGTNKRNRKARKNNHRRTTVTVTINWK